MFVRFPCGTPRGWEPEPWEFSRLRGAARQAAWRKAWRDFEARVCPRHGEDLDACLRASPAAVRCTPGCPDCAVAQ